MVAIDLLADLEVTVPDAKVVPPAPSGSTAGTRIMRMTERPPSVHGRAPVPRDACPTPQATSQQRYGYGATQSTLAASPSRAGGLSPTRIRPPMPRSPGPPRVPSGATTYLYTEPDTEKTIFRVNKGHTYDEYEVYDSEVPCNVVVNTAISRAKHDADMQRQAADARYADAAIQRDREELDAIKAANEEKRARAIEDVNRFKQHRAQLLADKAAEDAASVSHERRRIQREYERAVTDKIASLTDESRRKAQLRSDLAAHIEEKRQRESQERARELAKPHIAGFEVGAAHPDAKAIKEAAGAQLRDAWKRQLAYKADAAARDGERELRMQQQALDDDARAVQAAKDEKAAAKERGRVLLDRQKGAIVARGAEVEQQRASEVANDYMRAERDREDAATARRADADARHARKEVFRAQLVQQVVERARLESERAKREPRVDLAHTGLSSGVQRQVLLRCPVTNQMLPPSAFNAQQTNKSQRIIIP